MAESEAGIALVILGVIMIVVGVFFWPICGLGIILLIVGIVLMVTGTSRPAYYYPPPYAYPQAPMGPPAGGAPGAGPTPFASPACPVCGTPMSWIAQYGRWYCTRCQAYR